MVHGDSFQNCCVAIIVPEKEALANWASANGKQVESIFETQDEDFKRVLFAEIDDLAS